MGHHAAEFADLLADLVPDGEFCAQLKTSPDDLRILVTEVGELGFPVSPRQARHLCLIGRPARFGQGEQTLTDTRVRDTWEIPKSRVKIAWNRTLRPHLAALAADLGLPEGSALRAEFHSMLVYSPGQFFVPHQDSEKHDAMIGTLVVTLPSAFKGGELEIEHAGRIVKHGSPGTSLSLVAFYADCRHQVRPVTSGYRITLTYNLILQNEPAIPAAPGGPDTDDLASLLEGHFEEQTRLVYLLDHQYTERGLSWSRLKGSDAPRAALLRAAAEAADAECALALADVYESWSAYPEGWDRPRYGRYEYWDEDDSEPEPENYELQDLIDSTTTLTCWVEEPGSSPEPIGLVIPGSEICASTPNEDLTPDSQEYEGYMGNYGNTLDRWYRRAALVVWPRDLSFAMHAEASPGWALDQLAGTADPRVAQRMAENVMSFWGKAVSGAQRAGLIGKALAAASSVAEPRLAASLLEPFLIELLEPAHSAVLARLSAQYGEPWTAALVDGWVARRYYALPDGRRREDWIAELPPLCEALAKEGPDGSAAGRMLIAGLWPWLRERIQAALSITAPSRRALDLADLSRPLAALLCGAPATGADTAEMTSFCCQAGDAMLACLLPVLRTPGTGNMDSFALLAASCASWLTGRLARKPRAEGDWSIEPPAGCACELCQTLAGFLRDPRRTRFEWPLAEQRRRHIHGRIDSVELPVQHLTRRTGRPYTLVLTKTDELFERERMARDHDMLNLAWLRDTWDVRST